jgi:purine-binding chemotaxis protein CheW
MTAQYLTFRLAGETYAFGILRVREIIELATITRVPNVPPTVRGVINLRGAVVPVVDLAVKFGLAETAITPRTCVVIVDAELDGEPAVVGVLAESVEQVIDLGDADIEPPPPFGTGARVDFLAGLGRTGGAGFALILDIDRLFAGVELPAPAAPAVA